MSQHPTSHTLSEREFLDIIDNNSSVITRICYYYAQDTDDFNDLRQDVIANIWAYRDSFRGDSAISTWIYRLTLNTCISALRKRKQKGGSVSLETLTDLHSDTSDTAGMHRELYRMISRLSPADKAIILLWLDDLSYDNISDIIGIGRNTVATRLRRIKEKLAKMAEA